MAALYLIEILHQTTTSSRARARLLCCILSKFYIKPQPNPEPSLLAGGCILSKFYIKPQPKCHIFVLSVCCILSKFYIKPQQIFKIVSRNRGCILSKFYIKPQPAFANIASANGCILSKFYIKPQPFPVVYVRARVVSYRNSTSNHNRPSRRTHPPKLYLIEILHQTTTKANVGDTPECCILSKFYIKPQPEEEPAND